MNEENNPEAAVGRCHSEPGRRLTALVQTLRRMTKPRLRNQPRKGQMSDLRRYYDQVEELAAEIRTRTRHFLDPL